MWHSRASVRAKKKKKKRREGEKKGKSLNLGQTGGATAPPSCQRDEIRTRSKAEDGAMRNIHPPLPTPVITLLQANMSSLPWDFSYADVPSTVFPLLVLQKIKKESRSILLSVFKLLFSCFVFSEMNVYISKEAEVGQSKSAFSACHLFGLPSQVLILGMYQVWPGDRASLSLLKSSPSKSNHVQSTRPPHQLHCLLPLKEDTWNLIHKSKWSVRTCSPSPNWACFLS